MDNTILTNLCRQKIIISRLRSKHGMSAEIPALVRNNEIDFESIDRKAIELLLHLAEENSWQVAIRSIDMCLFTTDDEDGVSIRVQDKSLSKSLCEEETYSDLVETLMECNPDILKRECDIWLYLIQNMMSLNAGLFNDTQSAIKLSKSFPLSNKPRICYYINALEAFMQNGALEPEKILQSGYDIEESAKEITVSIYLLQNLFYPTLAATAYPVNSFTYGFNWSKFDCYIDFIRFS